MSKYIINFQNVKSKKEFYDAIINGMNFPKWCGHTPDAIWDMLTGYCKNPAVVKIVGSENLPENLKEEFSFIKKVFANLDKYYKDKRYFVEIQ